MTSMMTSVFALVTDSMLSATLTRMIEDDHNERLKKDTATSRFKNAYGESEDCKRFQHFVGQECACACEDCQEILVDFCRQCELAQRWMLERARCARVRRGV